MQLPDMVPAHQLLTPDLARKIYDLVARVAKEALEVPNDGQSHQAEINDVLADASQTIQQAVVDFVQDELERAAKNGRPFRLVARTA